MTREQRLRDFYHSGMLRSMSVKELQRYAPLDGLYMQPNEWVGGPRQAVLLGEDELYQIEDLTEQAESMVSCADELEGGPFKTAVELVHKEFPGLAEALQTISEHTEAINLEARYLSDALERVKALLKEGHISLPGD
jgi:hypothetical protein